MLALESEYTFFAFCLCTCPPAALCLTGRTEVYTFIPYDLICKQEKEETQPSGRGHVFMYINMIRCGVHTWICKTSSWKYQS